VSWSNGIDLAALVDRVRDAAGDGLADGAEHVLSVSNKHVPIEEATLERSGKTSVDRAAGRAAISYDTEYAVVQHEDPTLRHDAGRTAKFLENALNSERGTVLQIIGTRIRRAWQ